MNTGMKVETKRLILLPGVNERDAPPFLKMLEKDGNFREFCGVDLSERNLKRFATYFERTGHEECIYSIFLKNINVFVGYVGFHREEDGDYEIEFYVSKEYRRNGYCEEACKVVMKQIFHEGISVDGEILSVDKLYAVTMIENEPTIRLLEKLGFRRENFENGTDWLMQTVICEEDDTFYINAIIKMKIEKIQYMQLNKDFK